MSPAPRRTTFRHDNLVFDVHDAGPQGGEIVVLLHGFPQSHESWAPVAERLHQRGYRTLSPDQRGYSPGARPAERHAYTLDKLAGDVLALLRTLPGSVHLVGHDWGAIVAWHVASAEPHRVRTLTTLSVPHPRAFMRALVTSRQLLRSWYMSVFALPRLPEFVFHSLPFVLRGLLVRSGQRRDLAARDARRMRDPRLARGALNWYRAIPLTRKQPGGTASMPTLHVWSDGDRTVARRAAELNHRHVSGPYTFVTLPGVSHWIPEQAPERTAELLIRHFRDHSG